MHLERNSILKLRRSKYFANRNSFSGFNFTTAMINHVFRNPFPTCMQQLSRWFLMIHTLIYGVLMMTTTNSSSWLSSKTGVSIFQKTILNARPFLDFARPGKFSTFVYSFILTAILFSRLLAVLPYLRPDFRDKPIAERCLTFADCRLQTADCRLQTADCRLQTTFRSKQQSG